jgi:hypothetical protein
MESIGMGDREDSEARIARTRKSRYVTRRVETIPEKCDRPIIISKKEGGSYFAVRAYKVIHVSRKLIFAEMTGFHKD